MKDVAQSRWETKPLGEVCKFIGGGTPSKQNPAFWGGNFPWVSPKDMKSEIVSDSIDHVTESAIDQSAAKRIPEGSLLIVVRSGILARTIPIAIAGRELTVNQDLKAMIPDEGLDRHFVAYFLRSAEGQLLDRVTRGATVHKLDMPVIKSLPIPLPPLEEQQRIVAVLDEAFEGLARARAHAEANLQNARELFAGTISAEFSKIDSSEKRRVGDVAVHSLGKMLDKNKNKGTLRPYLRNLNVRWFTVDTSDLLEMRITDAEVERYTVRKGDLLICEGGYPGRSSIWEEDEEIFFQKALHRVRFEDEAYSRLLMYYLFMSDQSGALKEHCSGAGIQHFTGQSLAKFEMPFPTLDVAKKMISTIEAMQRSSKELEGHFQQTNQDLDDLRQSLLQKAFAGELTASKQYQSAAITANDNEQRSAQIIALAYSCHLTAGRDKTFGRVKAQKILHLAEAVCGIELGREPIQDAAGPNDMPHMNRMENWAQRHSVFEFKKRAAGGYSFKPHSNLDANIRSVQQTFSEQLSAFHKLMAFVVPMDTKTTEVLATVYAAWNNLIIDGAEITNEAIVRAARKDWHPDKEKIDRGKFLNAIVTIRQKNIEPNGTAKYVPPKPGLFTT